MAVPDYVLNRPSVTQVVHEHTSVDTQDNEDHTFNGIMFDVKCGTELPLKFVRIESLWVRGSLGPMKIFVTKEPTSFRPVHEDKTAWKQVYDRHHESSTQVFVEMCLEEHLILHPGQTYGIYVHSASDDDTGIVYDNTASRRDDPYNGRLRVCSGAFAHLNSEPFNGNDPWGWGHGWRSEREFVGRINYGVQFLLWGPESHAKFPEQYRHVVRTLLLCANREQCVLYYMPIEMIFFILNKLMWNSFGESALPLPSEARQDDPFNEDFMRRLRAQRIRDLLGMGGRFNFGAFRMDAADADDSSDEDDGLAFRDDDGNIVHLNPEVFQAAENDSTDEDATDLEEDSESEEEESE